MAQKTPASLKGKPPTLAKARRLNQCPTSPEDPMNVTQKPRASLRAAIDAACKQCIYDPQAPGGWRQQTHLCSCQRCPLWPVRPLSESAIPQRLLDEFQILPDDPCISPPRETHLLNDDIQDTTSFPGNRHCPENPPLRARFSGKAGPSGAGCP